MAKVNANQKGNSANLKFILKNNENINILQGIERASN